MLVVGALIAGALWSAGWPSIRRESTVTAATLFDLLKLVFSVVAGIGGVAALVVAYRRQRVAEHANKLAEFAHELAHAADLRAQAAEGRAKIESDRNGVRLFNERFAKASEQLGSDKAAVRLAGVYAMAGLADDWRDGRQTCVDVLCAYVRMPYTPTPQPPSGPPPSAEAKAPPAADAEVPPAVAEAARVVREERLVRHAVIRLIGRHLRLAAEDPASWRGFDFDFTGAVLDGGDLSAAGFSGGRVSFERATFGGRVSFSQARFDGAWVSFAGARFSDGQVTFDGATFGGGRVSFEGTTFSGGRVSFDGAVFDGMPVSFEGAAFRGGEVSFERARWDVPPKFDQWPDGRPPEGLLLPAG
ncbi:pentapeptide repeat-containing protein [Micromonospora zingiberis]|uniref:pentapeptide repeat-containing protein n=1 Tax=Micromonospora zingiberis TaxID=2053011 RepID=UPI0013F443D1|nr:pentapeptide repeat-containing protein [Micromonospora zingiberis]